MKAKMILLACAVLLVSACEETNEYRLSSVFKEYVKTDFDDPNDFIGITKIESKDTISTREMLNTLCIMDSIQWIMTEKQKSELAYLKHRLSDDSTVVVQHRVKARIKGENGDTYVKDFFIIEKNGNLEVRKNELQVEDLPSEYTEALNFLAKLTYMIQRVNQMLYEKNL